MGQNRVRAWVFGRVKSTDMLKRLYRTKKINGLGDDRFVIVRADIVDHSCYNVIIPVDAEDDDGLEEAVGVITGQLDVDIVSTAKVDEGGHVPWPPHAAHGFITEDEVEVLRIEEGIPIRAGRQHASPGSNKWG